jgi:hypothetical protein
MKMNRHQRRAAKHPLPFLVPNTPDHAHAVGLCTLHGVHRGRKFSPRTPDPYGQTMLSVIAAAKTTGEGQ